MQMADAQSTINEPLIDMPATLSRNPRADM
ncbi:hypothetical protein ABIE53_001046 [Burkholderia sp. OAS925]